MSDIKISALPPVSSGSVFQEYGVAELGSSKKINGRQLQEFLGFIKVLLPTRHTISSTTATEVIDIRASDVGVGTYVFRYYLIVQSTATTTGLKFGINFTGVATRFVAHMVYPSSGSTAATGVAADISNTASGRLEESMAARSLSTTGANLGPYTGVTTINADILNVIEGIIVITNPGHLQLWHGSEGNVGTSVEIGSSLLLTRIG